MVKLLVAYTQTDRVTYTQLNKSICRSVCMRLKALPNHISSFFTFASNIGSRSLETGKISVKYKNFDVQIKKFRKWKDFSRIPKLDLEFYLRLFRKPMFRSSTWKQILTEDFSVEIFISLRFSLHLCRIT